MGFLWEAGPPLVGHCTRAEPQAWGNASEGGLRWYSIFATFLAQVMCPREEREWIPRHVLLMAVDLGVLSAALILCLIWSGGGKSPNQAAAEKISQRLKGIRQQQREFEAELADCATKIRTRQKSLDKTEKNSWMLSCVGNQQEVRTSELEASYNILADTKVKLPVLLKTWSTQATGQDAPEQDKASVIPETSIQGLEEQLRSVQQQLRATKCSLQEEMSHMRREIKTILFEKAELKGDLAQLRTLSTLHVCYGRREEALKQKMEILEVEVGRLKDSLAAAESKAQEAEQEAQQMRHMVEQAREELLRSENSYKRRLWTKGKSAYENWVQALDAWREVLHLRRENSALSRRLHEAEQVLAGLHRGQVDTSTQQRCRPEGTAGGGAQSQQAPCSPGAETQGEHVPLLPAQPPLRSPSGTPWSGEKTEVCMKPGPKQTPGFSNSSPSCPPKSVPAEERADMWGRGHPPYPRLPLRRHPWRGPAPPWMLSAPTPPCCHPLGTRPLLPAFTHVLPPPPGQRAAVPTFIPADWGLPPHTWAFSPPGCHRRLRGPLGPRELGFSGTQTPAPAQDHYYYPPPP